ncbi:MAG: MerR family transcriptional regulator [Rhodothermaceae bacterium TMED105]|nr:MAG: MerR family transcriptional regulator [Rhodothermaceae bacterium TMED105]
MKKLYYSIGEICKMTGIEAHVLRYWETVFPQLSPMKGKSGARRYKEADIALILELQDLIHHKGYSTQGALKVLEKKASTPGEHQPDAKETLSGDLKRELLEIRETLSVIYQKL